MFKLNENLKFDRLPDSMCLDSETDICTYTDGDDTIEIIVRGYVTVDYFGERYRHFSDMPKELQAMFEDGSAYNNEHVVITENNWYEVFYNNNEDYDVAEIDGMNVSYLENYCKECMELFAGKKLYDVYFKPAMSGVVCVEAKNRKQAEEVAKVCMSKDDIIERIKNAMEVDGYDLEIIGVERV